MTLQHLSLVNCLSDDSITLTPPPTNGGGGAAILAIDSSSLKLVSVNFVSHSSHQLGSDEINVVEEASGGGAVLLIDSTATIDACLFENNSAARGGAIYAGGASVVFVNKTDFLFNVMKTGEGGGAIYSSNSTLLTVSYSYFDSNSANGKLGGAVIVTGRTQFWSDHNNYRNNSASYGGAIAFNDDTTSISLYDSYVKNKATNNAGGGYVTGNALVTWNNTIFIENLAAGVTDLLIRGGTTLVIELCLFNGTGAFQESQLAILAGDISVRKSVFQKAFSIDIGSVRVGSATQRFLMEDCVFYNNSAFDNGVLAFFRFRPQ